MVSTQLKNISQFGSFPQLGVKIKRYLKPSPRKLVNWSQLQKRLNLWASSCKMQSIWTCVSRTPLNVGPSNLIPIDLSIQRNLLVQIGIGHWWELTISYYPSLRISADPRISLLEHPWRVKPPLKGKSVRDVNFNYSMEAVPWFFSDDFSYLN